MNKNSKVCLVLIVVFFFLAAVPGFGQYRGREGVDTGFRIEYQNDVQVYSLELLRASRNFSEGRFGIVQSFGSMPILVFDHGTYFGFNFLAEFISLQATDLIARLIFNQKDFDESVLFYVLGPSPQFEYFISDRFKLTAGNNSDFIIIKHDNGTQGVMFTPKAGVDVALGIYHVNIYAAYQHFWSFRQKDKSFGLGIGFHIYSGFSR